MKTDDDLLGVLPSDERSAAEEALEIANKKGAAMYMVCKCQRDEEHPAGFLPIVVRNKGEIFVSAIVCTECGTPGYFAEGRLLLSSDDVGDDE